MSTSAYYFGHSGDGINFTPVGILKGRDNFTVAARLKFASNSLASGGFPGFGVNNYNIIGQDAATPMADGWSSALRRRTSSSGT